MNWILFGFKGVGKTHFGKQLPLPFLDTDQLIEKKTGCTPREIVAKRGIAYYRELEKKIIYSLDVKGHVIAVGGGAVLDAEIVDFLHTQGKLIYLKCPKEIIKKRLLHPPFPYFMEDRDPEAAFERHYFQRIDKYEKIDAIPIVVGIRSDAIILEELWQAINLDNFFGSPHGENPTAKPLV